MEEYPDSNEMFSAAMLLDELPGQDLEIVGTESSEALTQEVVDQKFAEIVEGFEEQTTPEEKLEAERETMKKPDGSGNTSAKAYG